MHAFVFTNANTNAYSQIQIYMRYNYLPFKHVNSQRQMCMLHADYQMFLFVKTTFHSMHILSFHQKSRRYAQTTESADLCDSQRAYIHANSLMYKKLTSKKRLHITKASGKKNAPERGIKVWIYRKNTTQESGKPTPKAGLRAEFYILLPLCLPRRSVV